MYSIILIVNEDQQIRRFGMTQESSENRVSEDRERQWTNISKQLDDQLATIEKNITDIANLHLVARVSGAESALDELMERLKTIDHALHTLRTRVVVLASEFQRSDSHIAEHLGLHRHTVRRWRDNYEISTSVKSSAQTQKPGNERQ